MNQLERFARVIHAAFDRDKPSFLAAVAHEHNAFTECWVLVTAISSNRQAHDVNGFYWSATMIARELGILPGTVGDALRLFATDGPASDNAALRFVKQAGDALMSLIAVDPTAWDAAKTDAIARSRCTLFNDVVQLEQICQKYVEFAQQC